MAKNEFYEKNGKSITTYPVVKNTVSKDLIDSIPDTVAGRRDFLKKHLNNLDEKQFIVRHWECMFQLFLKAL